MAVSTHYVELGLFHIKPDGTAYQRGNANMTIKESLNFETQHRVVEDADIPSSIGNPTIKAYLEAEAAEGYRVAIVNQSMVITEKIT